MEKSAIHKRLEETLHAKTLLPDNHDQVHVALGLLNAESSEKMTTALDNLRGQISGMQYTVSTTLEQQAAKMIKSNENLAKSNEKYARAMMWLTGGLVAVGLIQIFVR